MPTLLRMLRRKARAGQWKEALARNEQALSVVGEMQTRWRGVASEVRRRLWRVVISGKRSASPGASASKAYEPRATTSLARLLVRQSRRDKVRASLVDIYG
jgi:hypothetical protein